MTSKAYKLFKKTINRCETLVGTYELLRTLRQIVEEDDELELEVQAPTDIIRGAVVLSVSALDAYVTDIFAEKLVPYLKKYNPDESLIELLHESGLDTKEALKLIAMTRPFSRIRRLVELKYAQYTTQKFDVIDKMFLPFRLKDLTKNAENMSGRTTLRTSVQKLVERRHQIAHDGDYNSHGRLVDISDKQIIRRIHDLEIMVKNMDTIISNRI
jgi:hypothetical protein